MRDLNQAGTFGNDYAGFAYQLSLCYIWDSYTKDITLFGQHICFVLSKY